MTIDRIKEIEKMASEIDVPAWMRLDENSDSVYYRFLYLLAKELSVPSSIVELGTWRGVSAMCLAEGSKESKVFSYDIAPQVIEAARRSNIHYLVCDSFETQHVKGPVQILFIDTIHDGPRARLEFEVWLDLLSKDAVVLFDDTNLNDSMKEFWAGFNPPGFLKADTELHGSAGFGVLVRSIDDDGDKK